MNLIRPYRLVWSRTRASQALDTGSNPVGANNYYQPDPRSLMALAGGEDCKDVGATK